MRGQVTICHDQRTVTSSVSAVEMVPAEIMEVLHHAICERKKLSVLRIRVAAEEDGGYPFCHLTMRLVVGKCLKDETLAISTVAEIQQISKDIATEVLIVLICGEPAMLSELRDNEAVESVNHVNGHRGTGTHRGKLLVHVGLYDIGTAVGRVE